MIYKDQWLQLDYTKKLTRELEDKIKEISDNLGKGCLLASQSQDQIALSYANNAGIVEGLQMAIEFIKEESEEHIDE